MDNERISKHISYLLRHDISFSLELDSEGWVAIEALQKRLELKGWSLSLRDIEILNDTSDKRRWAIDPVAGRIRATHGHSLPVSPVGISRETPQTLWHGTATKNLLSIMEKGLLPGDRQQVHLSADYAVARSVGARHGRPFVIGISSHSLLQAGIRPICTSDGVWLSPSLPPSVLEFGYWHMVTSSSVRESLLAELRREVSPAHPLFGELNGLELVWRSGASDDCLFLNLRTDAVHQVHLTWIQKMETDPAFPGCISFSGFEAWVFESLVPECDAVVGDFV